MKSPYEHWNEKLLSLTPEQFEELCFDLIKVIGRWVNINWHRGGADKGRDITAERIDSSDIINTIKEKWFFQCKRYEAGIGERDISSAIDWAHAEKADRLVIISNSTLTKDCQDYIEKRKPALHSKITWWTDKNFIALLQDFPHVLAQYFPDDVSLSNPKKPGKVFELVLNLPENKRIKLEQQLVTIASQEPRRTKEILQLLDKEILGTGLVPDENLKALIYQQFSTILASKNEADAIEYLEKALEISPRNKLTMHHLTHLLYKQKKYDKARYYCEKILEIDENDKFALNNRGSCMQALGKRITAQHCFEKALEIDPNFIVASKNLAVFHMNQGDFLKAANTLLASLKTNKNHLLLDAMGTLFKELGAYKIAAKYHELAIKQAPFSDESWNNKGVALEHQSRLAGNINKQLNEQALQCFQKVIELNPTKALGWANISVCHSHKEDFEKATETCNKALELDPNELTALGQQATLLNKQGKKEEAIKHLNKILTKKQNNPVLKNLYGTKAILLKELGKINRAMKVIDIGLSQYKKSPELLDIKAKLLYLSEQQEKARKVETESHIIKEQRKKMINTLLEMLKQQSELT